MVDPPYTCINKSPDTVVEQHDAIEPTTLHIYTDGSNINGYIGTAVVAPVVQLRGITTK